jgi:hypothetical protein
VLHLLLELYVEVFEVLRGALGSTPGFAQRFSSRIDGERYDPEYSGVDPEIRIRESEPSPGEDQSNFDRDQGYCYSKRCRAASGVAGSKRDGNRKEKEWLEGKNPSEHLHYSDGNYRRE